MLRMICSIMLCCVLSRVNAVASDLPAYVNLLKQARAEYFAGRFVTAENSLIAALRLLEPNERRERATALAELGDVYANEDELVKAERAYKESLAIYKELADRDQTSRLLQRLGGLYSLERRDDDALHTLRQALKLTKTNPAGTVDVFNAIGVVYYRQGKTNKAAKFFRDAFQIVSASGLKLDSAGLLNNLGNVYQEKHQYAEAEDFLNRALRLIENEVGPSHPDLTFTLASLGILYTTTARYEEAENQYQRALRILEQDKSNLETRIARVLHGLSVTYAKAGRQSEADKTLAQAADIARRNLAGHADMADIVDQYSASLRNQGKSKEAEELRVEARRARMINGLVIAAQ
jgi:tetratricopeptide (TPR) repeat protein